MKKKPADYGNLPEITLPQMIMAIASMLLFFVFLITLYLNFYAHIFFSVWIWVIACAVIYSGVKKMKNQKDKTIGIIYMFLGATVILGGLIVIIIN